MQNKNAGRGSRRVVTTEEYDWSKLEQQGIDEEYNDDALNILKIRDEAVKEEQKKKEQKKKKPKKKKVKNQHTDTSIRERHQKNQKRRRNFVLRVRAIISLLVISGVVAVIMLATPLFNIKNISIAGNEIITAGEVSELVGHLQGTNLFLAGNKDIEKSLKTIKYVDEVKIRKKLFPPTIDLAITEYIPVAYTQVGSRIIVFDKNFYVIEENGETDLETIPCITGVKVKNGEVGKVFSLDKPESEKTLKTMIEVLGRGGILGNVINADFSDIDNITFNYDNRINVFCGSNLDFERKMRMFAEIIGGGNIDEDDRGEVDLSTGKAIYTP